MLAGVTIVDPATTWIEAGVEIEPDVVVHPFTVIRGRVRIEGGAEIGPFAYIRAVSVIGEGAKIGTFVEIKNAAVGGAAKIPHLSYVGDAEVGEGRTSRPATSPPTSRTRKESSRVGRGSAATSGQAWTRSSMPRSRLATTFGLQREPSSRMMSLPDRSPVFPRDRRRRKDGSTTSMESPTATELALPGLEGGTVMSDPSPQHYIVRGPEKRLMVFAGRSHPELAAAIAEKLGVELGDVAAQHLPERRDLLPLSRVDPGRRRLRRPDGLPAGGQEPDGARPDDPGCEARVGEADHCRDPVVPVLPAGPEGEAARADLRSPRGRHAPAGGCRPGRSRWICTRGRSRASSRFRSTT